MAHAIRVDGFVEGFAGLYLARVSRRDIARLRDNLQV
jgi:hypothetical protein